jgi:hypothetical protein
MPTVLADVEIFKPATARTGLTQCFGRVATTDATTTKVLSLNVAELESIGFDGVLVGVQSDYTDQIVARITGGARRAAAGNVTLTGTTTVTILESDASTSATVTADTTNQNVDFNVVGIAAQNWAWEFFGTFFKV